MKKNLPKNEMKTVLITGAAKRIGASLAQNFAKLNWNVIIHFNNSENEAKKLSDEINSLKNNELNRISEIFKADLKNENEIIELFNFSVKKFGKIDLLINNAGIFPEKNPLEKTEISFWDEIMNSNLRSQFLTSREFSKKLNENFEQKTGKIINFSSLGGTQIWSEKIPYNVSKAGIIQLTKALARELAPKISVNCVCPGIVFVEENDKDETGKIVIPASKIPMKRYANVEDIFEIVHFFATSTNYITGQIVSVSGGLEFI
jgi:3-oxoacyl-[acyl-carrier protein] reductase